MDTECLVEKKFYRSIDWTKLCGVFTLPKKPYRGFTLLLHGITMDKDEFNGFYSELAEKLCLKGFASLRFDFRGHGESEGYQREFSIIGQILDIKASIREISKIWKGPISIIATSFGAGAAIIYTALYGLNLKVNTLILVSPVIDYVATFLQPSTPWAREEFNKEKMKTLEVKGYLELDGRFDIGAKLIEELKIIKPYEYIRKLKIPVLTIHGDKDTMVPFEVSRKYGAPNEKSKLVVVEGADHGYVAYGDDTGLSEESLRNRAFIINEILNWIESVTS